MIDQPCLLVARFGDTTWGHWVGEVLVRAVLAEQAFPGAFRYVVPAGITTPGRARDYATAVLESLAAYGIKPSRLVRIEPGRTYRFTALHDVAGTYSDGIHPDAIAALRRLDVGAPRYGRAPRRIAAIRRPPRPRSVFNERDVDAVLSRHGFAELHLTEIPFIEQARMFREAEVVVASLGSDCISVLFAREPPRIVTLGPFGWDDGYFSNLFQKLDARHADVRGASLLLDRKEVYLSPHAIDPVQVGQAIEAVASAGSGSGWQPDGPIDGEAMPRRLGTPDFTVTFNKRANAAVFQREGWAEPEDEHIWSVGPRAALALPRAVLPDRDSWVEIDGFVHTAPPYLITRPLRVLVNGVPVAALDCAAYTRFQFKLPVAVLGDGAEVRVDFEHPCCASPHALGSGADARPLGFGFRRLSFHPISVPDRRGGGERRA